jgi:hypothetical protein
MQTTAACVVALLVTGPANAVTNSHWRSTLYPTNWLPPTATSANFETGKLLQDFSYAGYRAGEAPIPDVAGPVFNVTNAPYNADASGTTDATTAIQSAINAAQSAGGGVVFLPAGQYRISPQGTAAYALRISASGVVLRGAGVGQTFLLNTKTNMRSKSVIRIEGPSGAAFYSGGSGSSTLRNDVMGPTSVLPVTSTAGFAPGQWVVVRATCTDAWVTEHNEPGWLGYSNSLQGFAYFRRVTAVDSTANTVTVDAPTRYYLKTRDNARVVRLSTGPITNVGLEDFSLANVQHPGTGWGENDYNNATNAAYDVHDSFLVRVVRARDSWIRRVESYQPAGNTFTCHLLSNGILLNDSSRITIEAVHLQRPQYGGGGGNGYMYRLQNADNCLVQDSRATFSRHGFVLSHMGSSGNVFHRCVDTTTGRQTGNTGSQTTDGSGSDHHMRFSHSNLIDTCGANDSWWTANYRPYGSAPMHNLTSAHGVFWNIEGTGSGPAYVVRTEQSRYGYAIGTRGTRTAIDRPTIGGTKCNPADHVEGAGLGDTLEPFSLYEDQLARRLQLPEVSLPAEITVPFPSNSVQLAAAVLIGRMPAVPGTFTARWQRVNGPGQAFFTAATTIEPWVTFTERGTHELECTITSNGRSASARVLVRLLNDAAVSTETLPVMADGYVRDGAYAGSNYGTQTTLQMKMSSTGFNRRSFLRFNLNAATNAAFTRAFLEIYNSSPPSPANTALAETRLVASDTWTDISLTWSNQPALGAVVATWVTSTSNWQRIEVTSAALAERAGNGLLSLALVVTDQPSDPVYTYASREAATGRPRLVLESPFTAPALADWITNYPGVPEVLRGPGADPDGDRLSNAEEYLFGRDPGLPETVPAVQILREADGVAILYPQRKGLPGDFSYYLESTSALGIAGWQPAARVNFTVLADLGDVLQMRAFVPDGEETAQRFFRFRFLTGP